MSDTCSLHHIVINTHRRKMTINETSCDDVYAYLTATIENMDCKLLFVNGTANHIHLLVDLHPSVALANLLRDLKSASSKWLKGSGQHPMFEGWGREYYAYSVSPRYRQAVIDYIKNQKEHHRRISFEEELRKIVINSGHEWRDFYLT